MKFAIGQCVVVNDHILEAPYVDNCLFANRLGMTTPVHRKTYTIRGGRYVMGQPGYVLEEIVNTPYPFVFTGMMELHFNEELFSPVIPKKTSIEALRRLANPNDWTVEDHARYLGRVIKPKEKAA